MPIERVDLIDSLLFNNDQGKGVTDADRIFLCPLDAFPLRDEYFSSGSLRQESNIRPKRLFTEDNRIIQFRAGHLNDKHLEQAI